MEELANRRRGPFGVLAALFVVICLVVIALPDPLLAQIQNNRPLTDAQAGWSYRLLAFFAAAQIVYTGMFVFRIDHLKLMQERDERFARLSKGQVISSLSRSGATLVSFTLVYGLASIGTTGQRGGFWLFPVFAVAQGAWYYRAIGEIARWLAFQAEPEQHGLRAEAWGRLDPDYCPPLTRGLTDKTGAPAG